MCPLFLDPDSLLEKQLNQVEDYLEMDDAQITRYQKSGWNLLIKIGTEYPVNSMPGIYLNYYIALCIRLCSIYFSQITYLDSFFRKRKQIKDSEATFAFLGSILSTLYAQQNSIKFEILVTIMHNEQLFSHRPFCIKVIKVYTKATHSHYTVLPEILEIVEKNMEYADEAVKLKCLLKAFNFLIFHGPEFQAHEEDIGAKVLELHIKSIESNNNNLRYGIEVCIRRMLKSASNHLLLFVIENILETYNDKDLPELDLKKLEYSIKIAANWYVNDDCLWTCLKYETLRDILFLISSGNKQKCIFGNETFQTIIDSNKNLQHFQVPKIFFKNIDYKLTLAKQSPTTKENKEFLKRYRKELHLTFLTAVKSHRDDIKIIISVYSSICLLISEIPVDFTIALVVCLIMNIQKNILADSNFSSYESHRIHAVVISLMSLVCWVTKAMGLYAVLDKILSLRAVNAPFLNPPLKYVYSYATHYVLWNKPEFFFESFEVRYALWKKFKLKESDKVVPVSSITTIDNTRAMTVRLRRESSRKDTLLSYGAQSRYAQQ